MREHATVTALTTTNTLMCTCKKKLSVRQSKVDVEDREAFLRRGQVTAESSTIRLEGPMFLIVIVRIEGWRGLIKWMRFVWRCGFIENAVVPLGVQSLLLSLCRRAWNWLLPALRCAVGVGVPCSRGRGGRETLGKRWLARLSLPHVCVAGVGECSRRLRYRLNPEQTYLKAWQPRL